MDKNNLKFKIKEIKKEPEKLNIKNKINKIEDKNQLIFYILFIVLVVFAVVGISLNYYKESKTKIIDENAFFIDNNDIVIVDYELTVDNAILESTFYDDSNLEFVVGSHNMIVGFENAVLGLKKGQEITVVIPPDEGYGKNAQTIRIQQTPSNIMLYVKESTGKEYNIDQLMNKTFYFNILNKKYSCETIDYNLEKDIVNLDCKFYLAVKDLTFRIKVLDFIKQDSADLNNNLMNM